MWRDISIEVECSLFVEELELALDNAARIIKKHMSFDSEIYYDNTVSATCPRRGARKASYKKIDEKPNGREADFNARVFTKVHKQEWVPVTVITTRLMEAFKRKEKF